MSGEYSENKVVLSRSGYGAYAMDDKSRLVSGVLTSFVEENKFYGDNTKEIIALAQKLIDAKEGAFVARLAAFARREFDMRDISRLLVALLAERPEGKRHVSAAADGVTVRADDVTGILEEYLKRFGKPVPNSLKKALGKALNKFDEYQIAKYDRGEVNMADVLNLCHPVPADKEHEDIFAKIIAGNLAVPYTWETELSKTYDKSVPGMLIPTRSERWEKLVDSGKIGYTALLRNLANLIRCRVDNLGKALERIADGEEVKRAKVLPFRLLAAYKKIKEKQQKYEEYLAESASGVTVGDVLAALEKAADASVKNLPVFKGKSLVAIDVSYSMSVRLSEESTVTYADVAALLGIIAGRICEQSTVMTFSSSYKIKDFDPGAGILSTAASISDRPMGETDLRIPFAYATENAISYDRIILLSDNEITRFVRTADKEKEEEIRAFRNSDNKSMRKELGEEGFKRYSQYFMMKRKAFSLSSVRKYREEVNPDVFVHVVDMAGYGTTAFANDGKTFTVAGWSDKVLEYAYLCEQGAGGIVEAVESYVF